MGSFSSARRKPRIDCNPAAKVSAGGLGRPAWKIVKQAGVVLVNVVREFSMSQKRGVHDESNDRRCSSVKSDVSE